MTTIYKFPSREGAKFADFFCALFNLLVEDGLLAGHPLQLLGILVHLVLDLALTQPRSPFLFIGTQLGKCLIYAFYSPKRVSLYTETI